MRIQISPSRPPCGEMDICAETLESLSFSAPRKIRSVAVVCGRVADRASGTAPIIQHLYECDKKRLLC